MTDANRHPIHGGPFAACACAVKSGLSLIGVRCLKCGERHRGLFVIRPGKQVQCNR